MSVPEGSPGRVLEDDHEALDRWFERFRNTPSAETGPRNELFDRFAADLRRHIALEERILFPVFAEGDPSRRRLVDLMLDEHRRIEEMLERIHLQLAAGPAPTEEAELELLNVLWAHNAREEEAVYPWLDRHLSPELARSVHRALHEAPTGGDPPDEPT